MMNLMPRAGREAAKALLVLCFALSWALSVGSAEAQNRPSAGNTPGAPATVTAVALRNAAVVAWLVPASASDQPPITSYTIRAFDSESPHSLAATLKADAPGAVVEGLSSTRCYVFRVHAINAAGNGPESEPSEPTCPLPPPEADIALTMTAPAYGDAGSELTFTITVTNKGVSDAAMVNLSDTLPAPLSGFTSTQGACVGVAGANNFNCNLGGLESGASATVTVSVLMGRTDISNAASAKAFDADGVPLIDPVPGNNTAGVAVRASRKSAGN